MEKLMRLPPGFRFHPTDEELVVQYLRRKALSWPLPAAIIPVIDTGKYDPWDLPGCQEGERYYFSLQESRHRKGNRSDRATRSGYWKATGKDRAVHGSTRNELVGMKKVLVFHQGKPPHAVRTQWVMHEYRLSETLASIPSPIRKNPNQCSLSTQGQHWVVCRIFKKKKRASSMDGDDHIVQYRNNNCWDLGPRSPPTSSCVTDLSDEECSNIGDEEASSKLIASSSAP